MKHILIVLQLVFIASTVVSQDDCRLLNHSIGFHSDVSLLGIENGDYLTFNGVGFSPSRPVNFTGIPDGAIPFLSGDSLAGSGIIVDLSGDFSSTTLEFTGGVQPNMKIEGSVAGWLRLGTSSNTWDFAGLGSQLRIEPSTVDGTIVFRKQNNTELVSLSTSTGILDIKSGSQIRLTGKGGTGITLAGLDPEDDLTEITLGDGISITGGGAITAKVFHGTGAISGDIGDGQTLVVTYPSTLVSGVNSITAIVKATGSGTPTGNELLAYITSESTTGFTLSLLEQLESGESVNVSWVVNY